MPELVAEMKKLKAWNFFSNNPHLYLKLSGTFGKVITYHKLIIWPAMVVACHVIKLEVVWPEKLPELV